MTMCQTKLKFVKKLNSYRLKTNCDTGLLVQNLNDTLPSTNFMIALLKRNAPCLSLTLINISGPLNLTYHLKADMP